MSLMKTLAKVAVGVAVAKGAKTIMERSQKGGGSTAGGGLGGILGGLAGASGGSSRPRSGSGGLEDMLGGILGGGSAGSSGGLGGLLNQLGGGKGGSAGGLGGLLGGLAGAAGAGGLLDGLTKSAQQRPVRNDHDFGAVLNSQFDQTPQEPIEPSQDQEAVAGLMLAAMIQAAKSDGMFDDAEREKLLGQLGDVHPEEAEFVRAQMRAPVDPDALVRQTPKGMETQVYAMSLLGIDFDTQAEAQHLHKLAQGFGLTPAQVNDIHAQMGVPSLYT